MDMDMDMTMTMTSTVPSSTMTGMASTSSASDSSMTMSGMMDMSQMYMVFFTSHSTALFSHSWTPQNQGQYAGTCFFLAMLAITLRGLYAFKTLLEARWIAQTLRRRFVRVAEKIDGLTPPLPGQAKVTSAVLTTNGVSEDVKMVQSGELVLGATWTRPWRLSVDVPRALLVVVMAGIGYLLMLAVMTMNVGYFLSVLAGVFVGEVFLGRYTHHEEDHH